MQLVTRRSLSGCLLGLATALAFVVSGSKVHGSPFNVNDAFIANESGTPVDPNGPYTYGYTFNPTTPSSISTSGMVHSGPSGFNNTGPGVQGWYYPNNALVPAVLGNITNSPIVTNFGVTLKPNELLLHPGGISSNAFNAPIASADLQYTVGSAGSYTISGSFDALSTGGTGVSVYINGVQVFNAQDGPQGTLTPFSITQNLGAGSTIAFVVDDGVDGNIGSDSTGLFANIAHASPVPEPASMTLVGMAALSLAGLGLRRRRTS